MQEAMHKKFDIYMNVDLTKIQHVHFSIVSETERIRHYQLNQHITSCVSTRLKNTTTNYVDIIQSVHANFVDNTFHVYLN